jgi:hypothetical protein
MTNPSLKHLYLVAFLLLTGIPHLFSQKNITDCKVLLKEISGKYEGQCKNGLAEGTGFASGTDSYYGQFSKGLPDGNGVYTYKNGDVFKGTWKSGLKNGEGEFRYVINGKDSIVKGYWKKGVYKNALRKEEGYQVNSITGIENYSIKKTIDTVNLIEISFEKVNKKYIPRDLTITYTSGYRPAHNMKVLVAGYVYPVTCALHFTIPMGFEEKQCYLTFTIMEKGKWEVFISNN